MTLQSPAGTVVTITTDNAGTNDNVFNGTKWDDDANPAGQVPYTSNNGLVTDTTYAVGVPVATLVPEEPLDAFRGENPNGTWTITISDDTDLDGGSLDSWSLDVTTLAAAPTLSAPATFSNTTPVAIPTTAPPNVVTSTIVVSGAGNSLESLTAQTGLTHTFPGDLDVTLQSPAGTIVTLTTDNAGTNDDAFNGTVWNDKANPSGQVPYTTNTGMVTDSVYAVGVPQATLTPEESFGAFRGEDPNGTWTITISDDADLDGGSLNNWSLTIQTAACTTAAGVSVGGQVMAAEGRGLASAKVTLTSTSGVSRTVVTNRRGNFTFDDVEPGQTYVITVSSRRGIYQPMVITVMDNLRDLVFLPEGDRPAGKEK